MPKSAHTRVYITPYNRDDLPNLNLSASSEKNSGLNYFLKQYSILEMVVLKNKQVYFINVAYK